MSRLKDVHNSIWLALKAKDTRLESGDIGVSVPTATAQYRNKWEQHFATAYLDPLLFSNTIRSYCYECLKFKLADGSWFCPDFTVWYPDDLIELAEVKGWLREAARVRFLVARDKFPMFRWTMYERKHGQWQARKV
jgi:hypothetical protein